MHPEPLVDLLYLACNRLEFTRETYTALVANTDWQYVRHLWVYDDGSVDGTLEWLEEHVINALAPVRLVRTGYGSPVSAMVDFIKSAQAPVLAKIDNDAVVPPAWLRLSLDVLERHPDLDLLGIEAMYPHVDAVDLPRSYTPADFISGLGLYRSKVFLQSQPEPYQKYFGLEEWQMAQGTGLIRGWITPSLPLFLLDRLPFEPWVTYSDNYIRCGWQRTGPRYDPACTLWHWRWPGDNPR
jgi:glycosyltransferase involved in cell wall biosynthesis